MIHPISDEAMRPEMDIDIVAPPNYKRQLARPKSLRRRELNKPTRDNRLFVIKCEEYKALRHNERSCS